MPTTTIRVLSPTGAPRCWLAPAWAGPGGYAYSSLEYARDEQGIGDLTLRLPRDAAPPAGLLSLDSILEVWRTDDLGVTRLELDTCWFVRVPPAPVAEQPDLVELRAVCTRYLLAGRIVAYAAGSAQTVKQGPADDVMKAIVRENLGDLAPAGRSLSDWLAVEPNSSLGHPIHKTFPRRNVLRVLQEVATASAQAGKPLAFDLAWEPGWTAGARGRLVFRTYLGQRGVDRRRGSGQPLLLSAAGGSLEGAAQRSDHGDEATVVYCAGQGRDEERLIVAVSDDDRLAASPWNRRELYVDARYLATEDGLATEADGALWRRRPVQQFVGAVRDTESVRYGRDWAWGDAPEAEVDGEGVAVRIAGVRVQIAAGVEQITAQLRLDGGDAEGAVRRIEGQLDAGQVQELPLFTPTPTPGAVPVAGPAGTIAAGWIDSAIARTADLSAYLPIAAPQTTPTAHAVPRAGGDGKLADGWLSGAIARMADLAAYLVEYLHIEEVSILPTADQVPRAGGDGKLADGWLSNAIARLTDLTWTNLSGKPATFPPSSHSHAIGDLPVASSGVSSSTQLVRADDGRLSDTRPPDGSAGGDLSGNYPDPSVARLQGRSVAPTAPATGHALGWNGSAWTPLALGSLAGGISDAQHGNRGGGALHAAATPSSAGFLSAADKSKLDGLSLNNAWTTVTFQNSWVNYGGVFETTAYTKNSLGEVRLRGMVRSGTVNAAIFTLPVGFRPTLQKVFVVIANAAIGRVDVRTNGEVLLVTGSNAWVSLDGISFDV